LAAIYGLINGALFAHAVGSSVQAAPRLTVLPPDLFERYQGHGSWNEAARLPEQVRII